MPFIARRVVGAHLANVDKVEGGAYEAVVSCFLAALLALAAIHNENYVSQSFLSNRGGVYGYSFHLL